MVTGESALMKDRNVIHDLLTLVNSATRETNEIVIARALLENRADLAHLSMDVLSKKYYVSQASITRFIKKIGFEDFRSFKEAMINSQEFLRNRYESPSYIDTSQVISTINDEFVRVLQEMKTIPPEMYDSLAELISSYDRV